MLDGLDREENKGRSSPGLNRKNKNKKGRWMLAWCVLFARTLLEGTRISSTQEDRSGTRDASCK